MKNFVILHPKILEMSYLLLIFLTFAQINDSINDTIIVNDRIFNDSIDTTILPDSLIMDSINPDLPDSIQEKIQKIFDDENSGKGIVDESSNMLEMIDTLKVIPYFEGSKENTCNYPPGYIPTYPDSIYVQRIEELNRNTTMELVYNKHVKSFIDVYAVQKRDKTERILGLADVYFPLFEQTLDKYNMPLELKYNTCALERHFTNCLDRNLCFVALIL